VSDRKQGGGGTVILLAAAFAVGRWTAPSTAPEPEHAPATAPLQAFADQDAISESAEEPVVSVARSPAAGSEPELDISVYYRSCSAARDAGAAPIRAGEPGYAGHLDRDGDGVACE
jgi:hypothetical protein